MLKQILLDNHEFHFSNDAFPLLIHGNEGSGASLFTMSILADFYSHGGGKIVALTGFPMAGEEFYNQIGEPKTDKALFFTKDQTEEFIDFIKTQDDINERIIFIKNIELHEEQVFDSVNDFEKIIISGDINNCSYKEILLNKNFASKIYFSQLDQSLPSLRKYQGYLVSPSLSGIVSLEA